jgi:hypothetical protein
MNLIDQLERMRRTQHSQLSPMPPTAFSNMMAGLYPNGWDFRNWRNTKEWRLFMCGYQQAMLDVKHEATRAADAAYEEVKP